MLDKLQQLLSKKNAGETKQKNWYSDRHQAVLVQRNMLSVLSLVAIIFSAIAIFLVYRNIPIVTVEPFVIQVEPRSGVTQVVRAATAQELTAKESINNFFIVSYIKAREGFDAAIRQKFNLVRLNSDPSVFRSYAWEVNSNNPDSFVARNGGNGTRDVKIRSLARLDKNPTCAGVTCQIQARVRIVENSGGSKVQYDRVILMEYTYTTLKLAVQDRYLNPIGFRVLSYQVDNEVLQ